MNWKGRIAGLVVAVVAGGAIVGGTSVHSTAGAGTDIVRTATPTSSPTPLAVASPTPTAVSANPPQSVIEPPAPGADPSGAPAGVNGGPGALPSTGDGSSRSVGGDTDGATLFAVMGTILLGAGASAFAARRRG